MTTYTGNCGKITPADMTWSLDTDTGILTISGHGEMKDYTMNAATSDLPGTYYRYAIKTIELGNDIASIGAWAFDSCNAVKTLYAGSGLKIIGENALSETPIQTVDYRTSPQSVEIRKNAFSGCSSLSVCKIPLGNVGRNAFNGCSRLSSVNFADNCTFIEPYAFYKCILLGNLTYSKTLLHIGDYCFYKTKMTEVRLPELVTEIGSGAYSDVEIQVLTFGRNLRKIGSSSFDASVITELTLPQSIEEIGLNAFMNTPTLKTIYNYSRLELVPGSTDYGQVARFATKIYGREDTDISLQFYNGDTMVTEILGRAAGEPFTTTIPDASRTGFLLKWWVDGDGTKYYPGDEITLLPEIEVPRREMVFNAVWGVLETAVEFNPQGGRGTPARLSTYTENASATFTIPTATMTRRGYTFRGWATSANEAPSWAAGDTITVTAGTITTLYASWAVNRSEFTAQGDLYLPYCGIRIWKNASVYFNATFYQVDGGLAVISKAENRPGSATFTLANDYETPANSLCSDTFALWSDGSTGAIQPGMYAELLNIRTTDEADMLMDGRITTMTPNGETVNFEIGDGLTFLAKTGTWLRRNYRDEKRTTYDLLSSSAPTDGNLTIQIPTEKGTPSAAYRLKTSEIAVTLTKDTSGGGGALGALSQKYTASINNTIQSKTYTYLRRVSFNVSWDIIAEYTTPHVQPSVKIKTQDRDWSIDMPGRNIDSLDDDQDYAVDVAINLTGSFSIEISAGVSNYNYGTVTVGNCSLWMDEEQVVTVPTTTYTDTADSFDTASYNNRLRVIFEEGSVDVPEVMKQIAQAIGYGVDAPDSLPKKALAMFRAGGSYAQTYLQKLADQEQNGRSLSYTVDGASPTLRIGSRYRVTDTPKMAIKYGGDTTPAGFENNTVNLVEFAPKKTLKNRPNLVTLKANLNESNQAVTVCFEDPTSTAARDEMTIENLITDSNASTMAGIGSAAFAALRSAELDQWEGEITLPGIVRGIMSEGDREHAGSGVPLLISDSRYGLDSFRTRARQVEYNYNTCTTKVTLGNYDMTYSSGITNTNALAVEIRDMVGGISDTTLYNQQYVYVKQRATWTPSTGTNRITAISESGDRFKMDDSQVFELPDGSHVAVGSLKADGSCCLPFNVAFGINRIELAGTSTITVEIPEARRPDLFLGQTLTVCVLIIGTGTPE